MRTMVHKLLFLQEDTDTLEFADFFSGMEKDAIGMNLKLFIATFA